MAGVRSIIVILVFLYFNGGVSFRSPTRHASSVRSMQEKQSPRKNTWRHSPLSQSTPRLVTVISASPSLHEHAWADAIMEHSKATKARAPPNAAAIRKRAGNDAIAAAPPAADIDVHREAKDFFGSMKIPFSIATLNKTRVRSRSKLAVQSLSRWGGIKLGLFRPQSHEVEERAGGYPEHYIEIDEAAVIIKAAALSAGVSGHRRSSAEAGAQGDASGSLRYVQLTVDRETRKIQLVVVWNAADSKSAGEPLQRFIKALRRRDSVWHSISVNFNEASSNAIFNMAPSAWKLFIGPPYVKENVAGMNFCFPPQVFRQSNLDAFESLIIPSFRDHIRRAYTTLRATPRNSRMNAPSNARRKQSAPGGNRAGPDQQHASFSVLELYAGVGVLGGHAAAAILSAANGVDSEGVDWEVVCSDSNPFVSGAVFRHSVSSLPEPERHKLRYVRATAEEALGDPLCLHRACDVLVVNPPRKGLCDAVMQLLLSTNQHGIRRVIYVGCGFEALRQNVRTLVDSRRWRILSAEGFDLFPSSTAAIDRQHVQPSISSDQQHDDASSSGGSSSSSGSTGRIGNSFKVLGTTSASTAAAGPSRHIETMVVLDRLAPLPE